jgi:alpha-beta hydrolase superfamily lysophospholipase
LQRLSVSEAVMELDLTGTAVVGFRHAGHGRVNLVYRRPDGHIGWIDPPALDADVSEAKIPAKTRSKTARPSAH